MFYTKFAMNELGVRDVSKLTDLSPKTIYNLVYLKKIPFQRVSEKKVVFCKEEIEKWLSERKDGSDLLGPQEISGNNIPESSVPVSQNLWKRKIMLNANAFAVIGSASLILIAIFFLGWGGRARYEHRLASNRSSSIVFPFNGKDIKPLNQKSRLENIQISPTYMKKGEVRVKFSQILDAEIMGEMISEPIYSLILDAFQDKSQDYASRSKLIDIVAPFAGNEKIQGILFNLIKTEEDVALRLKALTALSTSMKSVSVKRAILERLLKDPDQAIRFKSVEMIENFVDTDVITELDKVAENETSDIIVEKVRKIISQYRNREGKSGNQQ